MHDNFSIVRVRNQSLSNDFKKFGRDKLDNIIGHHYNQRSIILFAERLNVDASCFEFLVGTANDEPTKPINCSGGSSARFYNSRDPTIA